MRLGIDLDGVVADFNAGWIELHRAEFGSDLHPDMVTTWDGLHELGGFADMGAFWRWARGSADRPSIFRHLEPYPDAVDTLHRLDRAGHEVVIITTKPRWARRDTLRWLADHDLPTGEIHVTAHKHRIACDVYLDDSPHVVPSLVSRRPEAVVCRFVRPWNIPVAGAIDVDSWHAFHELVAERASGR